ncbi:hypothetical protein BpV2_003 [Bathycoccus sp. RCC1105 virus BpV2]|nr:hypothetical protein BpV2_003 [Bathycoccus sp. RCC1105 virus BpV2]
MLKGFFFLLSLSLHLTINRGLDIVNIMYTIYPAFFPSYWIFPSRVLLRSYSMLSVLYLLNTYSVNLFYLYAFL